MSYSASAVYAEQRFDSSTHYLWRYLLFAVVATVVSVLFVIFARPWFWRIFGAATYGISILLLIVVLFVGVSEGEAQRWIAVGPITVQPSEVAKMAVVMMLALYMSKYEYYISRKGKFTGSFQHGFFMPIMIIGLICGLIALERHISGLMIVGMLGMAVSFICGGGSCLFFK
jgi:cell division protein FtsW